MNAKIQIPSSGLRKLPQRRGISVLYVMILVPVLIAVISLGVDLGRLEVAKTQMRTAVDAAARYGALGLHNTLFGVSAAYAQAITVAGQNNVDGSPLVVLNTDVKTGVWNGSTFQPNTDITACNAVQVTGNRTASRNDPLPLMMLSLFHGGTSYDMVVTAVALVTPGPTITQTVPATSNPFLSGALPGTEVSNPNPHNNPDFAGAAPGHPNSASPIQGGIAVSPGTLMSFDGVNGGANNFSSDVRYSADGNLDWICNNGDGNFPPPRDEQGIATMNGPINSLVGVFLDNTVPDSRSAPSRLDYSTDASRNENEYAPQLNQVFFIGDGRTDQGIVQEFTVPQGASRLFIGTWDCYEWNNNVGQFTITLHGQSSVQIVQ